MTVAAPVFDINGANARFQEETARPLTAGLSAASTSNADVSLTITPPDSKHNVYLEELLLSYSGTPTTGQVIITDGTTTITLDITQGGTTVIPLEPALYGAVGANLTVTLKAGGTGLIGRIYANAYCLA